MRLLRAILIGLVSVSGPGAALAQAPEKPAERPQDKPQEKPPEVKANHPPPVTFESLWAAYARADRSGDGANSRRLFQEIRRLRVERNIETLQVIGLALIGQGLERLKSGDKDRAEDLFRSGVFLAPRLPDGHFALARLAARRGPVGLVQSVRETIAGIAAPLPTTEGRARVFALFVPVLLLTAFLTTVVFAVVMVVRHGTLLLYDLREALGAGRSRSVGLAFYVALMLLPLATFQGWGWLPFWWLAVLFLYMRRIEKAVALVLVLSAIAVGPAVRWMEAEIDTARNPLFWAAVAVTETEADARSVATLEAAYKKDPQDADLLLLLTTAYRKAGRYEDAAILYREALKVDAHQVDALNNLANLDFARSDFPLAITRFKQAIESQPPRGDLATHYYNLSLAHLQRFEMQPADESLSQAKRLDGGLIAEYDKRWKYDNGNYAVVDLRLTSGEIGEKFAGRAEGVARKNVVRAGSPATPNGAGAGAYMTRFLGFVGIFVITALALWVWRGRTVTTLRCLKCGAASDRRSDRNAAATGLCTQCYHLFVVRDGISAPARNRKLLEVQGEEERRGRIFRVLSILSPGAGQLYGQKTLVGLALSLLWYVTLSGLFLAGRLPVSDSPASLTRAWGLGVAAVVLAVVFVFANRIRPDFDVLVPVRRASRKGRAA